MNQALVSVVVPLYNKGSYLLRCIESIRRQTMPHFEAIVVDDGSTDGGPSLVGEMSDLRVCLIGQPNQGPGAARNRGIAASRSELIAFLDADDEWEPKFLEGIVALARRYPEAGILATGFRRCYGGMKPDRETTITGGITQLVTDYFQCACEGDFVTSSSVAVPRAVFEQVGMFPETTRLGEDLDMWARIALRFPIAYDNRILATYHLGAAGRSFDRWKSPLPYPAVVHSLRRALTAEDLRACDRAQVRQYLEYLLLKYAHSLLGLGDRATLQDLLRKERFQTRRFRLESLLLRCGLAVLPTRVVAALSARQYLLRQWLVGRPGRRMPGLPSASQRPRVLTYVAGAPHSGCASAS